MWFDTSCFFWSCGKGVIHAFRSVALPFLAQLLQLLLHVSPLAGGCSSMLHLMSIWGGRVGFSSGATWVRGNLDCLDFSSNAKIYQDAPKCSARRPCPQPERPAPWRNTHAEKGGVVRCVGFSVPAVITRLITYLYSVDGPSRNRVETGKRPIWCWYSLKSACRARGREVANNDGRLGGALRS